MLSISIRQIEKNSQAVSDGQVTHHHLVDGVDDVVHLLPRDVSVVVDVVKSESP